MLCSRVLLAGVVLLLDSTLSSAQPPVQPKDGKVTVSLILHPAGVQQPVSRNYLLPQYKDSIPGNRVQMFLRCYAEKDTFFGPEESAKRDKWNELPLADLPVEELKDYGGKLLSRDAVDAARMLNVDWQVWYLLRRDGYETSFPDVMKMRQLAIPLKTRARSQIRTGDSAGAIVTLRTMFALARTLESHPSLIGHLFGNAIALMSCDVAEELLQMPGCPNLYWSFTDLPSPFLDLRLAIQGEAVFGGARFGAVLERSVTPMELDRVIKDIDYIIHLDPFLTPKQPNVPNAKETFVTWAEDAERIKTSRAWLVETGIAPEVVKAMSFLQVVVAYDVQKLAVYHDEIAKWMNLPLWETEPVTEVDEAIQKEKTKVLLASIGFSITLKIKQAQARLDQRIAYLRIIEAIRLHAHQHNGQLPASLREIKLPVPVDPVTGKRFGYSLKEGVITLSGGTAGPENPLMNRVYEVRLQQK